jgi:hypothetical protein
VHNKASLFIKVFLSQRQSKLNESPDGHMLGLPKMSRLYLRIYTQSLAIAATSGLAQRRLLFGILSITSNLLGSRRAPWTAVHSPHHPLTTTPAQFCPVVRAELVVILRILRTRSQRPPVSRLALVLLLYRIMEIQVNSGYCARPAPRLGLVFSGLYPTCPRKTRQVLHRKCDFPLLAH